MITPNVEPKANPDYTGYGLFDLFDIWRALWERRWIIAITPLLFMLGAVIWLLRMPDIYRGEVLLAPVNLDKGSSRNFSAFGDIGNLASLAGISIPTGGNTEEVLAVLTSRKFIWSYVEDHNLMPVLFHEKWDAAKDKWIDDDPDKWPTLWDAYRLLIEGNLLAVSQQRDTGLVRVTVDWTDAALASEWANGLVNVLNESLRTSAIERSKTSLGYLNEELARSQVAEMRQTLYQLISKEQQTAMLANTQIEFAFRVLDPSVPADEKIRPRRALIVLLAALTGGILAVFLVLLSHSSQVRNRRSSE